MANLVTVTDGTFEDEVLSADRPVLVDFWADWCEPCRMIAPSIKELSAEYDDRLKVAKVDVDENPAVPGRYGIVSIPTLMLFKNGDVVVRISGALPKSRILAQILPHLETAPVTTAAPTTKSFDEPSPTMPFAQVQDKSGLEMEFESLLRINWHPSLDNRKVNVKTRSGYEFTVTAVLRNAEGLATSSLLIWMRRRKTDETNVEEIAKRDWKSFLDLKPDSHEMQVEHRNGLEYCHVNAAAQHILAQKSGGSRRYFQSYVLSRGYVVRILWSTFDRFENDRAEKIRTDMLSSLKILRDDDPVKKSSPIIPILAVVAILILLGVPFLRGCF